MGVCLFTLAKERGEEACLVRIFKCCSIPKASQLFYRSEYVRYFPFHPLNS